MWAIVIRRGCRLAILSLSNLNDDRAFDVKRKRRLSEINVNVNTNSSKNK